jgi:hypothetical protein
MRMLAGPDAHVQFTNLSKSSSDFLASAFNSSTTSDVTLSQFSCHQKGVVDLMKASGILLERVCLLDPKAEKELLPEDGDGRFEWFLFGVCTFILESGQTGLPTYPPST